MNGRTDLIRHVEKCSECQKRQDKIDKAKFTATIEKLEAEIENCYFETELNQELKGYYA